MAGILNTVYVVLVLLTVAAGLGLVFQQVNSTKSGDSRWLEVGSIAVAFLFVVVMVVIQLL